MKEPTDGEAVDPERNWIHDVDPDGLDWRWAARAEIQAAKDQIEQEAGSGSEPPRWATKTWTWIRAWIRGGA